MLIEDDSEFLLNSQILVEKRKKLFDQIGNCGKNSFQVALLNGHNSIVK